MNNAIITWIAGYDFCRLPEVWAFVNSLDATDFNGRKIVFTHDMDLETEIKLKQRNYEIIHVYPKHVYSIVRDRFIYYRNYLLYYGSDINYVLLVDSKDVVFQSNPFPLIESIDKDLILVSEGVSHSQSEWNKEDQRKFQENLIKFNLSYENWQVINGGTIMGRVKELISLCLSVWIGHLATNQNSSEQATLNYLTAYLLESSNCTVIGPHDNNLVLTGEPIRQNIFEPEIIDNKVVCSHNKKPYCLFHQWERTKFSEMIMRQFGEKS